MGKGPGAFSEIGKKAKDLLFKDYYYDQKFTFSSKTDSGLKFHTTSVKKGEELLCDVKTELKLGSVDTEIKVDQKSRIHVKAEMEDVSPGVKLIVTGVIPEPSSTKAEVKFKNDVVHTHAIAGLVAQPVLEANLAFGHGGLVTGFEVGYDTATSTTTKYNFGIGYAEKDYATALLVAEKADALKVSYYQKIEGTHSAVAVELAHKISKKDIVFTAGGTYRVDPLTEAKARINSKGIAAALIEHEFRPRSTVAFSAEVDSKALDRSTKLGMVLNLKV